MLVSLFVYFLLNLLSYPSIALSHTAMFLLYHPFYPLFKQKEVLKTQDMFVFKSDTPAYRHQKLSNLGCLLVLAHGQVVTEVTAEKIKINFSGTISRHYESASS